MGEFIIRTSLRPRLDPNVSSAYRSSYHDQCGGRDIFILRSVRGTMYLIVRKSASGSIRDARLRRNSQARIAALGDDTAKRVPGIIGWVSEQKRY